jgi:hypothetical protein
VQNKNRTSGMFCLMDGLRDAGFPSTKELGILDVSTGEPLLPLTCTESFSTSEPDIGFLDIVPTFKTLHSEK